MKEQDPVKLVDDLKTKLSKSQRQVAALREKSKFLEMQYDDAKTRESNNNELVMELLERQRELNVMLNRANIMLNRTQEAMALSSMELNEMAKALPETKKAEWSARVQRVNDLFKQTGVQDAELGALESSNAKPSVPFDREELKRESEEAFGKRQSIWDRKSKAEPPSVHAEIVEEEPPAPVQESIQIVGEDASPTEVAAEQPSNEPIEQQPEDQSLLFPPRRKTWWRKQA